MFLLLLIFHLLQTTPLLVSHHKINILHEWQHIPSALLHLAHVIISLHCAIGHGVYEVGVAPGGGGVGVELGVDAFTVAVVVEVHLFNDSKGIPILMDRARIHITDVLISKECYFNVFITQQFLKEPT